MAQAALVDRIERALDGIRDYLRADGGDVRLANVLTHNDSVVVELELLGNCQSCSMSAMTMKAGIEQAIRKSVPEVSDVRTVGQ